jgi:hypothetical protein
MEEILDLISEEGLALPVRVFFQSLLLACPNVSGNSLHGFFDIPFNHGMNHIQMLFMYSRQGFGVMTGVTRGKDTDQIPHFTEKFQCDCVFGNAHEEGVEADIRHFKFPHLSIIQRLLPGFDQLIPQSFYFSRKQLESLEVLRVRFAFGYL